MEVDKNWRKTMSQIIIRDIKVKDLPEIKAIINETWDCDEWIENEETLKAAVGVYLNQFLSTSTFGKAAVMNNEVVGVIFGAVKGEEAKCRMLQENNLEDIFTLMTASENDRKSFMEYMMKMNQTYEQLLHGKSEMYDGTLDFFVVSEKARGLRIGKTLWDELVAYFKEHQVQSIYVYTDTNCNFGFYENNGFKRVGAQDLLMNFDGEAENISVFLYDYQLKNHKKSVN